MIRKYVCFHILTTSWKQITIKQEENQIIRYKKLKKKLYPPEFYNLKGTEPLRGDSLFFIIQFPRVLMSSWYWICRPRRDERPSWPWSHPVVLNLGPLDWQSSALNIKPLFYKIAYKFLLSSIQESIKLRVFFHRSPMRI